VFGPGRITEVAAEADRLGLHRVMLIADSRAPGVDAVVAALGERLALRWDAIVQHVPIELAERARKAAAADEVDGLVSLGGGSATGVAKAIALDTGLPIVAVPTTYAADEIAVLSSLRGMRRARLTSVASIGSRTTSSPTTCTSTTPREKPMPHNSCSGTE
jgi:maleylacetate reductase